jgi:hypothetical protein
MTHWRYGDLRSPEGGRRREPTGRWIRDPTALLVIAFCLAVWTGLVWLIIALSS